MEFPENRIPLKRTKASKTTRMRLGLVNPLYVIKELNNRSLFHFLKYFWSEVSSQEFVPNWHVEFLCKELEQIAERVGERKPKLHDLLINVSPGTTKSIICSIMFPAWCWTKWYWMRFITASYSSPLSLELAEYSRDLIRSDKFKKMYPELGIKDDKDTKGNFKVIKFVPGIAVRQLSKALNGGNRFSTSVGGTVTGFHADILIWDDALNPEEAVSEAGLAKANRWLDGTLSNRKTNKENSVTIGIMQRLHQNDPTGHMLKKKKANLRHISLPGEIRNYRAQLKPPELEKYYVNDLFDVNRMSWEVLKELEADLGQYGYAGQIGQNPVPPGGGMFKVDHLQIMTSAIWDGEVLYRVRYWDKAGSRGKGAFTRGVKMAKLTGGRWLVEDVKGGQWASEERERIIRETAIADGVNVEIGLEQEPGSGGKESAENTVRNLAGFRVFVESPKGDKAYRADPYSVQVNNGNVYLRMADWNKEYIEELRFFPFSIYKDQVDASSGAFNKMVDKRIAGRII